jgi:hypothetical protein
MLPLMFLLILTIMLMLPLMDILMVILMLMRVEEKGIVLRPQRIEIKKKKK